MGTSDTLRSVLDAGRTGKRLDELTTARLIGKVAERVHAAQQLAGPGKAVGPITPNAVAIAADGTVTLEFDKRGSAIAYSSPEQASGGAGDRRSDVFSLGCVMWEALTHARLFDAMNDAAVKAAVGEREIKAPNEVNANVPPELSAICMKALSRTASDRYTSAKVMGVEIAEFLDEAGYEDSNAKLAQFLAAVKAAKSTLPPPSLIKKESEKSLAHEKTEPLAPPSDKTEPMIPPAPDPKSQAITMPIKPPNAADRAAAAVAVPGTQPTPGLALAAKLSAAPTKPVEPAPPVLPKSAPSTSPAAASAPAVVAKASDAPAAPSSLAASLPPIESVGAFAPTPSEVKTQPLPSLSSKATIAASVPPPPALAAAAAAPAGDNGATTLVDAPSPTIPEPPKVPDASAPVAAANAEGSAPHAANPADVVSLPRPVTHRDSEQVLSRWAWQTDSTDAITDDDEDFHPPASRKPLYYVIGAGCAVALVVVIIAFAGGGNSSAKKPPPTAAKESTEPVAAAQPAVVAPEPPKQETPPPEPPKQETPPPEPPKAAVAPPEPSKAETSPPPEPPKAAVAPPAPPPKAEPPKAPPPKTEPPKVAKATPPKTEPPKVAKTTPPAKTEPPKSTADVEASYKQGLMKFARGDTNGALASLRTALAANPNYAPTWRGLGLVFEKLGEKDQARAAFKRYLSLAPGASDSEQIKGRMERL